VRRQLVPAASRGESRRNLGVIGKQFGHYLVLTELGSGGMGDVYVARDTKLERRVALKLPRPEVFTSPDRLALFRREAKAAAALNHPNIVHVYSVEEADGLTFITMELVEGRSLRDLLIDSVPLVLPRTLAFASQIAEGLACAHAAGVLHRDLKPANVMITADDRVKILDFGVAKFLRRVSTWDPQAASTTTEASSGGTTVGTVGYMSPEQALGKTLDVRSDLFALGVILFEMATGKAPFAGETPAAIFDELLNRRPPSPLMLNPALPAALVAVIDKALEKDPDRRHRSAQEFLEDLRGINLSTERPAAVRVGTAATRPASSVAVLPFMDMSPRHDQEYFCHGITEEIITSLARVPGLQVISRTSAFAFQGKDLEITEIGRRLRVATALEGSVRKAGDRVRVTAQLVNTEDGYQLWSRRFDRELSDVFAIQEEIAAAIVNEFRMESGGQPPWKRAPLDATVHDTYLKGMYALNKWTAESMHRAIAHFREAIAGDPDFAPAYAALAEAYIFLYSGLGILPATETVPQARWAVEKALALDPTLADAHKVCALIAMNHDWDRKRAEDALARALQLGPGAASAHLWNAWRLALLEGRHEQALIELQEAERLDPLDLQVKTEIGYVHYFHHDIERAIEQFEKVVALEPSFAFAHYALGDAYTHKGQFDQAFAEYNRAIELGGRSVNHIGVLGYAYGRSGNTSRAKEHLEELMARAAREYVSAIWIAMIHLGLSDLDSVFHWLDRAFAERDGSLVLITAAVEFDPVREDPRFKSLLKNMGLSARSSSSARG
jgi:serine/threonine protein kinase/tetratricopeptide (TPR) repeat protein